MQTILAQSQNGNRLHDPKQNKALIETLSNSTIYQDYERAFSETTGLPVSLRPVESWQLPHHGKRNENPFCAMMAEKSRSCSACLRIQQTLAEGAQDEPMTVTCELGLCDTAVPIKLGEQLIGFLQTGQIFRKKPTEAQFNKTSRLVAEWGIEVEQGRMREAFFNSKVLSSKQYDAMVKLLSIFAQHISMVSNQIVVHQDNAEPPMITRAKEFIEENQAEDLSLGQVAKAVNTSTFYFCKMFKKATGLNFTDYVSRVRIEKAKNLLLNPNLRISEIAYEVGFQSLTHFNRVFKKVVGQSPTEYREKLAG
ncbi:MAG: helix-turn-helix domain-containing protein [Verrucomicrobia bacterium]|nr:helix-turn-helix domain-containing protein [Verrucomicrobiota bacterium]